MANDTKFWDKVAAKYYKSPIKDEGAYTHKLEKAREYLNQDMQVLEIGCGTGGTALLHAPFVKHILATDISPKMIDLAKARPEFQGIENVTFQVAAMDELEVADASMDVVFAMSILHLMRDTEQHIQDIYRMLKPGGVLISSTACLLDVMKFFKWIAPPLYRLGLIPYVHCFSQKDLEGFIKNAGFSIDYTWKRENKSEGSSDAVFIIARK